MKMKNLLLKIQLIVFVLLLFSCDSSNPIKPQSEISEGVIPLEVGYKWTWNVLKSDSLGSNLMYQWSVEIIKDTMINDEKWYIQRENNSFNSIPMTNRDGVTYVYYNGKPTIAFNTVIEDTSLPSNNSNQSYLVSKDNIVETPLGKFNCNLYQFYVLSNGEKTLISNYYVAYNKGIIKIENFGHIDSLQSTFTTELISTNVF